jgi:alpha-glucosidase
MRIRHSLAVRCVAGAIICCAAAAAHAQDLRLSSPDGAIRFSLGQSDGQTLAYSIERDGETVIAPSPLGFSFADRSGTGAMTARETGRTSVDRRLPLVATKAAQARDHYNEMTVSLSGQAGPIDFVVRAYDDGIAFRYRLPAGAKPIEIASERTGFYLPAGDRCWGLDLGSTTSSHEAEFEPFDPGQVHNYRLYDTGLACRTAGGGTHFLFAEADLTHYAGLGLRGRFNGSPGFEASLSPLPGGGSIAVRAPAGEAVTTPWRVILMAPRAGDLIASTTIGNLNPQPSGDFGWVKPGKTAWDWWSGPYFPGRAPTPMNQADLSGFIDFAGRSGFPYMLIDEGWALRSGAGGSAPADTDITATQPGLDMPALVARAKRQNVGLLLWLQWSQLDKRMDEALDQYVRWGIKGVKVDFMDRNDQDMVAFYHRLIPAAARRHLLIDLHGAYAPTGYSRTFPNFITQEGVMGAEYNKGSNRITATHNVHLAYTRMVLGPMDYTPGGFRNRTPADFRMRDYAPEVQTTRGQALAMYVVYESPLQMVSDSPDAYAGAPEFAFLRAVPTTWDETRFLDGDIDSHVVVARRKGRDWYIGAMTNEQGRTVTLPLSFLGTGHYRATIWQDGGQPTQVVRSDRTVGSADSLTLTLAPSGGAAVTLRAR